MKMGLLKSVNNVPGIDFYEYRDNDYYNKFKYRARFYLFGVRYTWYSKTSADFIRRINNTKKNGYLSIRKEDRAQILSNIDTITAFIDWRDSTKIDKTASIRVEHNTVAVFSNDLELLRTLENLGPGLTVDYTEAKIGEFIGVKYFVKEPKHKYRVYFKSRMIEGKFVVQIRDLISRTKELHPSDSLKHWLRMYTVNHMISWKYRYTNANHFIEYDDESTLSYLALMHGEILGKRYKLEKRPEPI